MNDQFYWKPFLIFAGKLTAFLVLLPMALSLVFGFTNSLFVSVSSNLLLLLGAYIWYPLYEMLNGFLSTLVLVCKKLPVLLAKDAVALVFPRLFSKLSKKSSE